MTRRAEVFHKQPSIIIPFAFITDDAVKTTCLESWTVETMRGSRLVDRYRYRYRTLIYWERLAEPISHAGA
jgi:hypothetical protein